MARKIVFAWGRFNPPTTGHKVVMDRVAKEAKSRKADYAIFASKSNDPKKNPLTFRTKVKFLKQSFPKHAKNINASPRLKTVLDVMIFLNKKYQEVSLVVGADRAAEFKKLLNHYNGREYDFEEIEIISAGERDPDADDVTGMSASKMRKAAAEGNYTSFRKGSPMKNPRELYNAIRRGMKINEEVYSSIIEAHEFDVSDQKVAGRRFNAMLRFGLVPTKYIPITRRAFGDLKQAGPNPELRKHVLDVTDKVLEYIMADDLLYRRFLLLLHDDFLMKEDHRDALLKKAEKSQLSYTSLLEVFLRGLASSPIYGDKTAHQHAFDRVNSYVAGGHSRKTLDADIWESSQQNTGRNSMKRLRDIKPPEWGTKKMANRYSKVTPGQPDDIGEIMVDPHENVYETAPPGKEAEAFIKDNKGKFKERYGDKWEQVLYATAWKVYGKNESVDEARSAGYKMPQSKDPYTVKYAASKRGKIQVTVVDGEKAAKKFLADVKKQGMNGIITKGAHQKEEVEQIGEAKVIKVRGGDAVEIGKSKRGGKVEYYWKAKNGLKNVFDSPEKLRYSLRNTANFSGAEKAVDQLGEAYKTPAEKKAERLAKIARASAAREKGQAKEKEKATAKHNKASAKSREAIKYRGNKDQFGRVREEEDIDEISRKKMTQYVKGASDDLERKAHNLGKARGRGGDYPDPRGGEHELSRQWGMDRLKRQIKNRKAGINRATGKLAREDVDYEPADSMGRDRGAHRILKRNQRPKPKSIKDREKETANWDNYWKDKRKKAKKEEVEIGESSRQRADGAMTFSNRQTAFSTWFYQKHGRKPTKQELRDAGVGKGGDNPAGAKAYQKAMKKLRPASRAGIRDKFVHGEEVEIDEAKMGAIARDVRKGSSPYTVVAILNDKVVDQDHAKIPDQVPAIVRELKKDYPKAKISIEDRSGKVLHTEDIEVAEGGMGMIGRTKPSRELNVSREEKPYLAGKSSLKDKKRAAHKSERSKAKNTLRNYKKFSEASFMVDIEGIGKVVIDGTSAGEIKASLRKKLRSKDDLGSVERIGVASKKKHFMSKAKGKEEESENEE